MYSSMNRTDNNLETEMAKKATQVEILEAALEGRELSNYIAPEDSELVQGFGQTLDLSEVAK